MGAITYRKYKALGLCPRCGKLHTEGKVCDVCKEKHRAYTEKRKINMTYEQYESIKNAENFNAKYRYKLRKKQGLCTRCGKYKGKDEFANCVSCRKKHNAKQKKWYRENKRI